MGEKGRGRRRGKGGDGGKGRQDDELEVPVYLKTFRCTLSSAYICKSRRNSGALKKDGYRHKSFVHDTKSSTPIPALGRRETGGGGGLGLEFE